MGDQNITEKSRLLIAPLDWGLGHATRCIPIIRQALQSGADVFLAGEGPTANLLHTEFPQLPLLPLKGYEIQYGKNKLELIGKLLLQIPKIIDAMDEEHDWLHTAVDQYGLHGVISDNRYGLYSDKIPSIIITHQLLVKTGMGGKADRMLQKLHYGYIQSFNECWVPDVATSPSLAGELAHPPVLPATKVQYIGTLSRFANPSQKPLKHLLILLSGPEPQRTLLEKSLVAQLGNYKGEVVLVRGLPDSKETLELAPHVMVFNHLPAAALEVVIKEAHFVIARTGYSTVMDLMALRKKSILIPTSGQTEQEYLAEHLMEQRFALCISQDRFRLGSALDLAGSFPYNFPETLSDSALKDAIDGLLQTVSNHPVNPPSSPNPWP
ncbi:MAG: glycosyl transferase family 28 [Flaviaesturariibacter sp.]|nr:glycosyl transferase family 28 [Flaviaesturariibacter sp.]